jgi:uncharacterized protein (UPF0248 family)
MAKNIIIPINVSKESIAHSQFPAEEVLTDPNERAALKADLEKAEKLVNLERTKIKIIFEDSEAVKSVETTVWATTDKRIILKSGLVIPIHRIHQVKII